MIYQVVFREDKYRRTILVWLTEAMPLIPPVGGYITDPDDEIWTVVAIGATTPKETAGAMHQTINVRVRAGR